MNKKILYVVIVAILLIGGAVAYLALDDSGGLDSMVDTNSQANSSTSETPDNSSASDQQPASVQPGQYVDYDEEVIASTVGTKILFFHAPWCPQCRALEADIKDKGVPAGVTVIKVDYDSNQSLRQKYGVTIQTSLVLVDDSGNLVKKYVAYDEPTVASLKANLL